MTLLGLALAGGAAVALAFFLSGGRGGGAADSPLVRPGDSLEAARDPRLAGRGAGGDASSSLRPAAGDEALGDLLRALRAGDPARAREAAAALRRAARTDALVRADAFSRLLDPALDSEARGALALVLGTLSGSDVDPALLAALGAFGDDPDFVRSVLLALGAQREPEEDDDVFDLGSRPYGVEGPGGLGVTVRREIESPDVRAALLSGLGDGLPAVREAAVLSLRQSLAEGEVRAAFGRALEGESADEVATPLGEALASWARAADADVQAEVSDLLVSRAAVEGFDAYRFRLEDDLARLALGAGARRDLLSGSARGRPFAERSFALTVLASHARGGGGVAAGEAAAALLAALASEEEAPVRDLAARLSRELPHTEALAGRLARVAAEDPAWNVRYSALDSLVSFGPREEVLAALRRAASDSDERVRSRAAEALAQLAGR
jgi:hypothetical protein